MTALASTPDPASVTPLSVALGILAFVALVALIAVVGNAARYVLAAHRRGMARVHAADQRTAGYRARRNRRTIVDVETDGTVTGITVARPGR
jgi:hypothetical protein